MGQNITICRYLRGRKITGNLFHPANYLSWKTHSKMFQSVAAHIHVSCSLSVCVCAYLFLYILKKAPSQVSVPSHSVQLPFNRLQPLTMCDGALIPAIHYALAQPERLMLFKTRPWLLQVTLTSLSLEFFFILNTAHLIRSSTFFLFPIVDRSPNDGL